MYPLEDHFLIASFDVENAFVAQHLLSKDFQNASQEVFQLLMVKGFITTKNEGLDAICVPCMVMVLVIMAMVMPTSTMVVIMIVTMIMVVVIFLLQEMRVNF
jgi:hypothetical protein